MPFEPLGTDEKLTEAPPKKTDFETQLMHGCAVIVLLSVFVYFMTVWPFVAFPEYKIGGLIEIAIFGWIPPTILGIFAIRRFQMAGFSGFLGGAMAGAAFMFLRLQQTMLNNLSNDMPHTEYGGEVVWLVPIGWMAVAGIISLIFLPRSAKGHENDGDLSRS